jgi:hypothetical protein
MTNARLNELLTLAEAGDEDVILLVQSEIALMPETREDIMARHEAYAEEIIENTAPVAEPVDDDTLSKLAEDADF